MQKHVTTIGKSGQYQTFTDDIEDLSHEELINKYYDLHLAYTELTKSLNNRDVVLISFLKRAGEKDGVDPPSRFTSPQTILCLKLLLTGRTYSKESLLYHISSNEDAMVRLVRTVVTHVRGALQPLGITVQNQSKTGYYISRPDIRKFKELLDTYEKETF